jgi:hypothetical protein
MPTGKIKHLAFSDQGGRPDGVQVMVSRNHLYVGHMFSDGFTIMDVADPSQPKPVQFVAAPPNTRTHHLQTNGDLMLIVCGADIPTIAKYNPSFSYYGQSYAGSVSGRSDFTSGLKVYDISKPAAPVEIGFLPVPGIGLNRLWYVGGRYAYLSAHMDGFTDHILVIADMKEPTKPTIAGRWWMPGMWREGGEVPSWDKKRRRWDRICRMAGWRLHDPGRLRSGQHQALVPRQYLAALCRRHAHAAAPAGAKARRHAGGIERVQLFERSELHLALRRSRSAKPGLDRNAADPDGSVMVPAGREFRPA